MSISFLSVEDVLLIHSRCLARDGGLAGVRDLGLLSAAVMMPRQTFGGQYVHEDMAAMAAAYLFHLASNHPFLDGNKRVALATAIAFLIANQAARLPDQHDAADITLGVASGDVSKQQLIEWFRRILS